MTKELHLDTTVWELFPEAQFSTVLAQAIDNTELALGKKRGRLNASLQGGCIQVHKYLDHEALETNPLIQIWNEEFRKLSYSGQTISSVETLFRRAITPQAELVENPLTDIIHTIAMIWALPIAGFDLDQVQGSIRLGIIKQAQSFITDDGRTAHTGNGALCFTDDEGILQIAWTDQIAKRTAITQDTKNAILITSLIDAARDRELKASLGTFARSVTGFLGGEASSTILDIGNPTLSLLS